MRTLKLQVQTTIDGFVAGPAGKMGFMVSPRCEAKAPS
jgi:hypothetical protein